MDSSARRVSDATWLVCTPVHDHKHRRPGNKSAPISINNYVVVRGGSRAFIACFDTVLP